MGTGVKKESDADKLQRRNRELSILNTIAEALNREINLNQALETTLAQVADLLNLETGWIWLLREETGGFYLAAAQNLPPALLEKPQRMEGSCYCLDTYEAGDLSGAANVNVVTCSRLNGLVDGTDGLRYHASIPLYAHEKQMGVLNLASTDWRELSPNTLRLLHTIGDLLSIAIERARLFDRSTQLGALEERNRLAREIHDTVAQGLSATILHLETAEVLLDSGKLDRARRTIERALEQNRTSLEEVRRSVMDLRAAPLEGSSLSRALSELIDEQASGAGLQVGFEVTGKNHPLPTRVETGLYRMAQEALNNVIQHANATQLFIELVVTPSQAELVIEDNGQGFEPAEITGSRFGLIGLNERARLLGGTLQICSSPGEGTRLTIVIPLELKQ